MKAVAQENNQELYWAKTQQKNIRTHSKLFMLQSKHTTTKEIYLETNKSSNSINLRKEK